MTMILIIIYAVLAAAIAVALASSETAKFAKEYYDNEEVEYL